MAIYRRRLFLHEGLQMLRLVGQRWRRTSFLEHSFPKTEAFLRNCLARIAEAGDRSRLSHLFVYTHTIECINNCAKMWTEEETGKIQSFRDQKCRYFANLWRVLVILKLMQNLLIFDVPMVQSLALNPPAGTPLATTR